MKILFYDTETNSLDAERGFIMELAWAVYDVESCRLLHCNSHILKWNMHYEVDPGALAATGLTREFCEANGVKASDVFMEFITCANDSEIQMICGHNAIDFDNRILKSNVKRALFSEHRIFEGRLLVDTMYDLPFLEKPDSMKLKYLAYDHGYSMTNAHQAMADVFACAHVFFCYKTRDVIPIAATDLVTICGYTEFRDEVSREAFYKYGFRWNKNTRRQEKRCRSFYVKGIQLSLGDQRLFVNEQCITPEPEVVMTKDNEEIPF